MKRPRPTGRAIVLWHNCKSLGKIQRHGQKDSRKLKLRKCYRLRVRIIYIIDGRCRPPLITAGIPMISPKIESRWGQDLRQTKDVHSEKKEKSAKEQYWEWQNDLNWYKKDTNLKTWLKASADRNTYFISPLTFLFSVSIYIARPQAVRTYASHHTHLFSFSSMYSWSDTSGNWTTLTRTGLELCRSLLTSWTLRSWLQISPVTCRRTNFRQYYKRPSLDN